MKPLDYLTWLYGDVAKDFGGKDPGAGRSLADKRAYLVFVGVLCAVVGMGLTIVGLWPLGVVMGLISLRKCWIYCTITG